MSLGGVYHDVCGSLLFDHPIVRPFVPTGLCSPHLDFRLQFIKTAPFITSVRVPIIPSIRVPFIPSIRAPLISHPTASMTTRQTTSTKEHEFKKQTNTAYLSIRDGVPTCQGDIPVPNHYDEVTMALQPTLQARQGYELVSISRGQCARYLSRRSSQDCNVDLPQTDLPMSFPEYPLVVCSDEMKHLPAIDPAMEASAFAAAPVTRVATAILDSSSITVGQSKERVHGSSSFPGPGCAGGPNTASGGE